MGKQYFKCMEKPGNYVFPVCRLKQTKTSGWKRRVGAKLAENTSSTEVEKAPRQVPGEGERWEST